MTNDVGEDCKKDKDEAYRVYRYLNHDNIGILPAWTRKLVGIKIF